MIVRRLKTMGSISDIGASLKLGMRHLTASVAVSNTTYSINNKAS